MILDLKLVRCPTCSSLPAIPDRGVFYVADPISSIETRSLPTLTRSYPRHFTFYVADPISSIPDLWQQEVVRALQPPHLTISAGSSTTSYGA